MNAKLLRSQKGFTLIELMIVVGIIGILVAIAAPNFSRYQSKARQSEAKIALSAIYAAEKSFFSEYSAYVGSMNAIGYSPEGLKRYYAVGFNNAPGTGTIMGFSQSTTDTPNFDRAQVPGTWTQCTGSASMPAAWTAAGNDPPAFLAGANGQIREGRPCDQWTINQDKRLYNSQINL